jgi:ion channel-forming bestrophin family protein
MRRSEPRRFWRDAFTFQGSATPQVLRRVLKFTLFAVVLCIVNASFPHHDLGIEVAPYEFAGAALGLLLVLRTNAGYDRWWEGRKLWGGIVNQTRDLSIAALAYGPPDPQWRQAIVRWTAAFAHVTRRSLRGERDLPEVAALLGDDEARRIAASDHMPNYVNRAIGERLREARERMGMDPFGFLQVDRDRALLIDHMGACERILKAPLPHVYSIHIRQFIFIYLSTLPFALLHKLEWLTPLVTVLVAYPILALDQIGIELQNPFDTQHMGHLPLDDISATIEQNLLALLENEPVEPFAGRSDPDWRDAAAPEGGLSVPA